MRTRLWNNLSASLLLLLIACTWAWLDLSRTPLPQAFKWGDLMQYKNWWYPVTTAPEGERPWGGFYNSKSDFFDISCLPTQQKCWLYRRTFSGENEIYTRYGTGKWEFTHRLPKSRTGGGKGDIHFLDEKTGWLLEPYVGIFQTQDGGKNWKLQLSESGLDSLFFVDAKTGWAIGSNGRILSTINGGADWQTFSEYHPGVAPNYLLSNLFALDHSNAWVVGSNGVIFVLDSDKKTWKRLDSWPVTHDYYDVYFINTNLGWIVGSGGTILNTQNGGLSWTELPLNFNPELKDAAISDIHFFDKNFGWLYSNIGFFTTNDGGDSWIYQEKSKGFSDVTFIDAKRAWAFSEAGIFATEDGGNTWNQLYQSLSSFSQLAFIDEKRGWLLAGRAILATVDGGKTWGRQAVQTRDTFEKIIFKNKDSGWAAGDQGLWATNDGGQNWLHLDKIQGRIWEMVLVNNQFIRVISEGKIWEIDDKNQPLEKGEFSNIYDIAFSDQKNGWARAKAEGEDFYSTSDGGDSWKKQNLNFNFAHSDIPLAVTKTNRPVVIIKDLILTWDNTWHVAYGFPQITDDDSINFLSSDLSLGWLLYKGFLFSSNNKGESWQLARDVSHKFRIKSIQFSTSTVFFGLNEEGQLLKSIDTGQNWEPLQPQTKFQQIIFANEHLGWGIDQNNQLMKTENGGNLWLPLPAVNNTANTPRKFTAISFAGTQYG